MTFVEPLKRLRRTQVKNHCSSATTALERLREKFLSKR